MQKVFYRFFTSTDLIIAAAQDMKKINDFLAQQIFSLHLLLLHLQLLSLSSRQYFFTHFLGAHHHLDNVVKITLNL